MCIILTITHENDRADSCKEVVVDEEVVIVEDDNRHNHNII